MRSFVLPRFFACTAVCGGLLLCGAASARADAFSPIPPGDPIYRGLSALSLPREGKTPRPTANLTRYEAALEVARAAAIAGANPDALSRSGWRALRELTIALHAELRQLGVDTADVLRDCDRQTDTSASPSLPHLSRSGNTGRANSVVPGATSFLSGTPSPAQGVLLESNLESPLLGKARVEAALLSLKRDAQDPFSTGVGGALGARSGPTLFAGKNASFSLDVNSWLRVSALASQRRLGLVGDDTPPALGAPLFAGAREAKGFGGGLELSPIGGLKFSTEIERLSTDVGTTGTRVGGGIGLSAWQNRLTLSAHLSRLQPEDRAILPATATELGVGVGVTQRLSLNLLYQGLFSSQSESSRMAGGLNLSF